jgi:signal transduction histidine kinase/ligand-binding sensor domain-containing protein/DNA-binding response OmpR family regulator
MVKTNIFLLSFLLTINCFSQDQLKFKHLGVKDGLSSNNVLCVLQDQKGFLWFGTANGLNRYDGYSFKTYQHDDNDSLSLSNNYIRVLAIDQKGRIWIGTNNGLNCLDPVTDKFYRFSNNPLDSTSLSSSRISALYYSKNNILWVGTDNGLNKFNPETSENVRLTNSLLTRANALATDVNSITEDAGGAIWIGMWWGGLKKIDPNSLAVTSFFSDAANRDGLSNDNVLGVYCDTENNIWASTYMDGVRCYSNITGEFLKKPQMNGNLDLGVIEQDHSGKLWIKGKPGSLVIYDPVKFMTTVLLNEPENPSSISTGYISSVFCDRTGIVWLATDKGISYYNPRGQLFTRYLHQFNPGKRAFCNSFFEDDDQQVWIAVYDVGVVKYNLKTAESRILTHNPDDPNSINHKTVNGIAADATGNIWLATNNGICILDSKTCKVIKRLFYKNENNPAILNAINARITNNQSCYFWQVEGGILDVKSQKKSLLSDDGRISINNLKIRCILNDRKGDLWIGTEFLGLKKFEVPTGQITDFVHIPGNSATICSNTINDIFESQNGNLWISTPNGLSHFDSEKGKFTNYSKQHGLSANDCFSVKEDSKGNIWILTSGGLDKFNVKTGSVMKYDTDDGLLLNQNGLYQNEAGYIFGGHAENGFYCFHPDSIPETVSNENVFLTDFFIFNEPVLVGTKNDKTPLRQTIQHTKEIVLNHSQNVFGFEFSALNFSNNGKSRYAYKLDGFDEKWSVADGKNRRVTYTNLDPGKYVFRVKAATGADQQNTPETVVDIIILAPWWATGWAYSFYFIAFMSLLFFIWKYFADRQKLKHEIAIQKIEQTKTEEIAQLKQQFFTNISHEFRTPLTLISGPVDNLIQNIENTKQPKLLENLQLIKRNSERLSQLTNQLLDIRKLETNSMKLEIVSGDIFLFIMHIAEGFNQLAEKKQIKFNIQSENPSGMLPFQWFDPDKIHTVVANLLSNAFKFTPEKGTIKLTVNYAVNSEQSQVSIEVEDSGIGIKPEELNKVFDRFYQVENAHNRMAEGTGIGLALTRELVLLHGGNISVESQAGKGTRFIVHLTVNKDKLANYIVGNQEVNPSDVIDFPSTQSSQNEYITIKNSDDPVPLLLLVEDNDDMRLFITNILSVNYRIIEAVNGKQGLEIALTELPDIIISDVMMPLMDGFEFTNRIKTDERTSHIPVILLTSLTSSENVIEGLENEADEYLTKPFNEQILRLKLKNILLSRQKLMRSYLEHFENNIAGGTFELTPSQPSIPDTEKIFLDKLISITEQNMTEADFDVSRFAFATGMEASVLHRKLKALINQSPGDFIRTMRMKRAAQLLADKSISISEVAYKVGFGNNTNYFSTAFRKHFGKTPKEFQRS